METARPEREQIMVVETEHGHYGFVVDQVLGDHQTVIKNLGRLYRDVQVVSGATILGNGTVALILDPHRLVQNVVQSRSSKEALRWPEQRVSTVKIPAANSAISSKRKTESMSRKANGKKQPRNSGNGGTAVPDHGAREARARAGSGRKRRTPRLRRVSQEILRLVEASRQGRLDERGKVDQFQGTHREMVQGINEMLDAILLPIGEGNRILAQISDGKIDELIAQTYKGDHEKMKQAVNNVGTVVQGLQKELMRLTEASKDGQLSERGKPDQFRGAYADIVRGVNAMLDAILLPIGEGNRILAQISNGKIDELIAHTYKGDHEKMKQAVNNVGAVVQDLQKELMRLTKASKQGKLTERGKPDQFQGAYAEIVRGVNAMLDAVITPLNVAADYVDKISRGDIPSKISDTYNGDFNTIKNNLNSCIDNINALVADATMLAKAAVEGNWRPAPTPPSTAATTARSSKASTARWTRSSAP